MDQLRLVVYPIIYKVLYIQGGAGYLTSINSSSECFVSPCQKFAKISMVHRRGDRIDDLLDSEKQLAYLWIRYLKCIYIYTYCKQTVASTLITAPIVKTPLPAAKLLRRQLLVFPQVTTRVSQEATKACRKRNAKGLPQPRPTTVTNWQHHESHPPFHLRLPEPKGACKERWIPWIMVMWNVFIVMCKDVEFTLPKIL